MIMSLRCFARFWRNRFSWSASFSSWITSGLTFTFTFSWSASSSTWITSGRSKSTTGGGTPPSRWRTTFHLHWNTSNIFLSSSLGAEQWTWQTLIVKLQSTRWRWKGTGQAERAKNTDLIKVQLRALKKAKGTRVYQMVILDSKLVTTASVPSAPTCTEYTIHCSTLPHNFDWNVDYQHWWWWAKSW